MAKYTEEKLKGVKAPAAQRCNRTHPRSPHQRRARRRAEALVRQAEYDALTADEKNRRNHAAQHPTAETV